MSSTNLHSAGRHPANWIRKPLFRRLRNLFAVALAGASVALAAGDKSAADSAKVSAALTPGGGRIVVEAQGVPPAVPLFFSASADQTIRVGRAEIAGEMRLKLHVVQGRPEVLTLGLSGDGEVTDVSGKGLRDWSVSRTLALRPASVFSICARRSPPERRIRGISTWSCARGCRSPRSRDNRGAANHAGRCGRFRL